MKSLFPPGPILLLFIPLCWGLSCKGLPKAEVPAEAAPYEDYGDTDYDWSQDDDWPQDDDAPSLVLPPGFPSEDWPTELDEPLLENGEAFLPDQSPEEGALVLAEPLPEPLVPDLPSSEPAPEPEPVPEPEAVLAEEPAPEESPAPPEPPPSEPLPEPEPVIPPPPPRIVRPAEPIPPPPPAREPLPLPPNPVPDLPARNPPTLTPAPVPAPPGGVSSRIVRAVAGQIVEIPFRGTGWVYLGESGSKRGINYNTRRLDPEGQTFIFQTLEAGTYELKFYRQDFIRDYLINDLVTVIVEDAPLDSPGFGVPVDRGRVIAEPRWPTIPGEPLPVTETAPPVLPDRAGPANTRDTAPGEAAPALPVSPPAPAAEPETEAPPSPLPPGTPAEEYLRRAREEYGADHIPEAIAILNQFMAQFPLGSDEALWLYAQLYEKQGPFRDIRLSLDYYRRLVNEYPQSNRYNDSRRRIAYLERYYINIQ